MSWPNIKLGTLCDTRSGGTPRRGNSEYYSGKIPWVKIGDLDAQNGVILDTEEKITEAGLASIGNRIFKKGTILLSMYGSVGKVAIAGRELAINQAILGLTIKDEKLLYPPYFVHWLRTIQKEFIHSARGGTLQNINQRMVRDVDVPLPPIEEQIRIAAILDKTNNLTQVVELVSSIRDQFHSSLQIELFGDSTVENKYQRSTIGENSFVVSKGTTPMTHGMGFVNEGIPFLRVEDLTSSPIAPLSVTKAIDESTHEFLSRSQLKSDDILVSIAGTIGRISIVPKNSPQMNCNQAVAFIRLNDKSVFRHTYLMHWLRSRDARIQMADGAVTGTISNLSLGKIKQLKVPVPPMDLQVLFEKIIESFNNLTPILNQYLNLNGSITQGMFA